MQKNKRALISKQNQKSSILRFGSFFFFCRKMTSVYIDRYIFQVINTAAGSSDTNVLKEQLPLKTIRGTVKK